MSERIISILDFGLRISDCKLSGGCQAQKGFRFRVSGVRNSIADYGSQISDLKLKSEIEKPQTLNPELEPYFFIADT